MCKILDGKLLKNKLIGQYLLPYLNSKVHSSVTLAIIVIGNDPQSAIYVRNKKKLANELRINVVEFNLPYKEINQFNFQHIKQVIDNCNKLSFIKGIIVQLPIPTKEPQKILDLIDPSKDIDGLTKNSSFIPCTALGILQLLQHYDIPIKGKNVVIIGRSNLVGKPIANLLLQQDATVTICHSHTKNLAQYTSTADILISATTQSNLITPDMIKEGVVAIDVGIEKTSEGWIGNISKDCYSKCSAYTPVPGGVGPMTVYSLFNNLLTHNSL